MICLPGCSGYISCVTSGKHHYCEKKLTILKETLFKMCSESELVASLGMAIKEKIKKTCRVRNLIRVCLISLFLWWGSNAVLKYWSQPLSTDVSFKYGDTELGIQFPLITLCQGNFFIENPIMKYCNVVSWNFIDTIFSCMKSNTTFKVTKVNYIYIHILILSLVCLLDHVPYSCEF